MTLSPMENILNRLGKRHSPSSNGSGSKAKRPCTANRSPTKKICTEPTTRVPFGTFLQGSICRNKIANAEPEELATNGHYSIDELVLPNCSSAICTTFQSGRASWLQHVFSNVDELLVLKASSQDPTQGPTIGNAEVLPMLQKVSAEGQENPQQQLELELEPIPNWYWIQARVHTGGCLHGKMLLLRSPREGLRVVICGSNLYRGQWDHHRDVFFVQDFPVAAHHDRIGFGNELLSFLTELTLCVDAHDQEMVSSRIHRVFDKIDFSSAKAKLVVSMPRTKAELAAGRSCGGWKQLAIAAHDAMLASGMGDMDDDDEKDGGDNNPQQRQQDSSNKNSLLYANSGSMGNVEPDFLLQMYQAMNGENKSAEKTTRWVDVVNRVRCLWPSIATACKIDLIGLKGASRHIPRNVLNKIKRRYRNEIFRDAIPNPPTLAVFEREWQGYRIKDADSQTRKFHPATHGKFLWNSKGVLYVGSHNFSKAAWGQRKTQPRNVEVGVVLATPEFLPGTSESIPNPTYQLWQDRFPCRLDAQPSPYYAA